MKEKAYPILQPDKPDPDHQAYANIRRSHLHNVAARPAIFPCVEMVRWIVDHVNLDNRIVVNATGSRIASFQDRDLEECYKFVRPEVALTTDWLAGFSKAKDYQKELSKWWIKELSKWWIAEKQFRAREVGSRSLERYRSMEWIVFTL